MEPKQSNLSKTDPVVLKAIERLEGLQQAASDSKDWVRHTVYTNAITLLKKVAY